MFKIGQNIKKNFSDFLRKKIVAVKDISKLKKKKNWKTLLSRKSVKSKGVNHSKENPKNR